MVEDLGNTLLTALYGSGQECYIISSPPAKIHLSMPEGEASIILNNWTQIALGRYKRLWEEKPAFGHSLSYQSSDSDRSQGASHFSLFCFLISLSFSTSLFVSKIDRMILLTALFLPKFIVPNSK